MNRILLALALVTVGVVSIGLGGCDELSARSEVQKGNEAYGAQEFEKAAKHFEKALQLAPGLDVAHHNAGIAYSRMFHAGVTTPENKAVADKATEHLAKWLEKHPNDADVRKLITGIWIDADEYDKALAFWKKIHDENPKARDVIEKIANIYLKSGDWRSAAEWYQKDVEAATDVAGKVSGYKSITFLALNQFYPPSARDKILGNERREIAELGLEAAQHGIELAPDDLQLTAACTQLWVFQSTGEGPSWAQAIDLTEAQTYEQRANVLKEQAKQKKAASGGASGDAAPPGGG